MSSSKLPLYLRSNISKEIEIGSLVVNPNVDFKIYKVLIISNKHILVIDEKLILHKFKIKNFVNVNYIFNIDSNILGADNIPYTTVNVSKSIFEICKNLIKENNFFEVFDNNQILNIDSNKIIKINSKIIITSQKSTSIDFCNDEDKSVSWLDHYATIKLKDSNEKIYLSFARNAKVHTI